MDMIEFSVVDVNDLSEEDHHALDTSGLFGYKPCLISDKKYKNLYLRVSGSSIPKTILTQVVNNDGVIVFYLERKSGISTRDIKPYVFKIPHPFVDKENIKIMMNNVEDPSPISFIEIY